MKRLSIPDMLLLLVIATAAILLVVIITKPTPPCTLSFEVHKGVNFDQPYPTYRNCGPNTNYPILVEPKE